MIEKIERVSMLFDFYGKLLTGKQREILSLHYEQDFSLGEIAEEYTVSRQAVHDILKRSENILEGFEAKLGLVKKFTAEREKLNLVFNLLCEVKGNHQQVEKIKKVIDEIVEIQNTD